MKTIGSFAGHSPTASLGPLGETDLYLADTGRVLLKHLPRARRGYLALRERLMEEVRFADKLVHPGFLPFLEAEEDRSGFTIAYRFVAGVSLSRVIQTLGRQELSLPLELAVHVVRTLARATSFIHRELGLVLRELCPENVILAKDGQIFIATHRLDLGHPERDRSFEQAGHLAPECFARSEYSLASDVYALGATLYTVLTGQRPVAGSAVALEQMGRVQIPESLIAIVAGATHPVRTQRYRDARRLAIELDAWMVSEVDAALMASFLVKNRLT